MTIGISPLSKPKVSFLVPTYNRSALLKDCITSILAQTYKNIEIIVIDDASADDTERMIAGNFNGSIKYHKNAVNQGVAYSRNSGLTYATGDYIGLLDSDDILYEPSYVEMAISVLEKNSEISIFCCDAYCIDLAGNKVNEKTFFQRVVDHREIIVSSGIKDFDYLFLHGIHSCGAIFRKNITKEIGFLNTDYRIAWDEDFFLRVAARGKFKIYYRNIPSTGYRIHNNSFSRNLSELYKEKIKARYDIIRLNNDLKARLGIKFNKRIANQYYCLCDAYLRENRFFLSFLVILKAMAVYPPIFFRLISRIPDFYNKRPKRNNK